MKVKILRNGEKSEVAEVERWRKERIIGKEE